MRRNRNSHRSAASRGKKQTKENIIHLTRQGRFVPSNAHSFKCACAATQKGQRCGSLSEDLSSSIYMSQVMRLWYLSYRRPAKAQGSLHIRAISKEPSLFAHMKYGSRRRARSKIRHVAPLDGYTCAFEDVFTEDEKCHNLTRWLNIMCVVNSDGSGQTARMRRLS